MIPQSEINAFIRRASRRSRIGFFAATLLLWLISADFSAFAAEDPDLTITNQAQATYTLNGNSMSVSSGTVVAAVPNKPIPKIEVKKTATTPIAVTGQANTYDVTYRITVRNIGQITANYIHLADNLNCTFRSYESPAPVKQWTVIQTPQVVDGPLTANTAYSGSAGCGSDSVSNFDTTPSVQLVDGKKSLQAGESAIVEFGVRMVLMPALPRQQRTFLNTVVAASLTSPDSTSDLVTAASSAAAVTPVDPSGVIYNSQTREPVSGAVVTLFRDNCPGPITEAELFNPWGIAYTFNKNGSVSMTTGSDGAYSFYLNRPDNCTYHLTVKPPKKSGLSWVSKLIPPTSGIAPPGAVQTQPGAPAIGQDTTYYLNFQLSANADVWNNHIPVDPKDTDTNNKLFLNKEGSKIVGEIGDIIGYQLTLKNNTGGPLDSVRIKDVLPRGFRLISGSVRLNGKPLPDPAGAPGAPIQFNLTGLNWDNGDSIKVTYQAQIGAGVALEKASINRAQAFSGSYISNRSSWAVTVTGGVFSEDAFLIGKVYLENCKADKMQDDPDEMGVPGVRLLMEDGTTVVTDAEGKYSLYGLTPITHVLKLDKTTLPAGARLIPLSNRNSGKGDSVFVDLKKGELHKTDFAVDSCNADTIVEEVKRRHKALEAQQAQDGLAIISQHFSSNYSQTSGSDPRSLPASGVITPTGPRTLNNLANGSGMSATATQDVYQTVMPGGLNPSLAAQRLDAVAPHQASAIPLEEQVKSLDNKTGFIDIKNGDILPTPVANIRVKGLLGSTFSLSVNGVEESLSRVGKKSSIADKKLEAWEYVGVNFKPGKNTLDLVVIDPFGNARDKQSLTVVAPGEAGRIQIEAPATSPADSKTPVMIKVSLVDDNGVPVTVRTPLTLELDHGKIDAPDLNPNVPGIQAFMEGGSADFTVMPPGDPIDASLRISAGQIEKQIKIAFLPDLRPLVGAGIVEGVVNFNKIGKINLSAPNAYDSFERELRNFSASGKDINGAGRAAFFFKGTIKGDYLLTTAYDSDKDTKQRLFRDIQPDKFYPIYGDSSIKGFDAQSTQRFYLRIDKKKSYLLYGDFTTTENSEDRKLSQYSRSATGLKGHFENNRVSGNAWISRDNLKQVVVEIPANGTSGPYKVPGMNSLYENSEKVEILVRDRNQPTIILESIPMSRFQDYSIDLVTHEIFFKGPVASLDANLNPRTIRIIFESEQGGKEFFKGGIDARVKVTDNIEVGASYAKDDNPQQKNEVMGATSTVKLGEKTTVIGEIARTDTGENKTGTSGVQAPPSFYGQSNSNAGFFGGSTNPGFTGGLSGQSIPGYINQNSANIEGEGWAERIQIRHDGNDLKVNAQLAHADKKFNNPTSGFGNGRTEATVDAKYKINNQTNLIGEGIYSKDAYSGGLRAGILAGIEHAFNQLLSAQLGIRAVHQELANINNQPTGITYGNSLIGTSNDLLTIRGKLAAKVPWVPGLDVFTEAEQDVLDIDRHMFAVGGGYLVNDKTRVYGRYEFISSLNSPYALNSGQQNNQAVIGVESAYSKDGRLFSEYRLRDAINGREAQAAMGIRHTWNVADGLRLGGSFETTHAFAGQLGNDSTAVTALAEYTGDPRYKATGSLEARFADSGNSWLNTLGLAYKINKAWSLLARHGLSIQENSSDQSELLRTRQQIGLAWREVDENRWNALARYEHRWEEQSGGFDPYTDKSHIVSTHVNYQPINEVTVSGRYAAKWSEQERSNAKADALTHLAYGRLIWDFLPDWDVSVQAGVMKDDHAIQFSSGLELGYQVISDLWASAGYNLQGFDGGDIKGTDYTQQGFYLRFRYKFDEGLFN